MLAEVIDETQQQAWEMLCSESGLFIPLTLTLTYDKSLRARHYEASSVTAS